MEMFGILLSIPAAFGVSTAYAFLLKALLRHRPRARAVALLASVLVLGGLLLEWSLLFAFGPVQLRGSLGPTFYGAHLLLFFLSVPSLATLIVAGRLEPSDFSCFLAGVLCAILALPVVLTQYGVSEALYGHDGMAGPYGTQ